MLGKYYIALDSLGLPNPVKQSHDPGLLEEVNASEAGTDLVTVVRTSKAVFSWTWHVESKLHDTLIEFGEQRETTLLYRGKTYTGRFRVLSSELVEGSAMTEGTDGLYEISATFIEK